MELEYSVQGSEHIKIISDYNELNAEGQFLDIYPDEEIISILQI